LRAVSPTELAEPAASAAPPRDDETRGAEDIAYVAACIRRCREILDAARLERESREQPIRPVPRRPAVPGQDWCYRCARGPHLITEADHRPVWPLRRPVNGRPPVPVDNWPPVPCEVPEPTVISAGGIVSATAAKWQGAAE
jgi:hypothetical protein